MASRSRKIKFDYFKVYAHVFDEKKNVMVEKECNLTKLFTAIQKIPAKRRIYKVSGDVARIQEIALNSDERWEMHLIRIRKDNYPVKTHDDGTYTFMDLSDQEGLGEEVSVLYDPETSVIMIRRNINSLSPSSLSNYFNDICNSPGMTIFFKPLIYPNALDKIKEEDLIRGLDISIANIRKANNETKRALGSITGDVSSINESVNINLSISLNKKGSSKLSRLPLYNTLKKLVADPVVTKAEVRKKKDENSLVEKFDLISDKMSEYISFTEEEVKMRLMQILKEEHKEKIEKGEVSEEKLEEMINLKTIHHKVIIKKMKEYYNLRLNDIKEFFV
ncbi:hypothetical protein AC241_32430 (plasmid) [Bacillus thuringiensis]|uniref:DUF6731 family protein n=1 Tax=Bacillus thuringiensis TaxID=1428 RepID=UPI000676DBBA|nr:DUF6731 family protein [Bacillus thuringiensis]AKR13354.1 hypothetical protein AC241_32430 [Bacillus thuringiensis]